MTATDARDYRVLRDHHAIWAGLWMTLIAGTTVRMDPEQAAWVNRDGPGTLELIEPAPDPPPEPAAPAESEPEPESEPAPESKPEPESEPAPRPVSEPEQVAEPDSSTEPDTPKRRGKQRKTQ